MHIDRLEKRNEFPKGFKIGRNAVVWFKSEVAQWQRERLAERDRLAAAAEAKADPDRGKRGKSPKLPRPCS